MTPEQFEAIAEQVHIGWMQEKQRQGFAAHAWMAISDKPDACAALPHFMEPCALPKHRHHNDMLPYADLAEHVKEYDRVTVRAVLAGIDATGLCVAPAAPLPRAGGER